MKSAMVMDAEHMERAVSRLAHEIVEQSGDLKDLVLLGIPTRGAFLALRLRDKIKEIEGCTVAVGAVDATMYRDDIGIKKEAPSLKEMDIPVPIDGKVVVIVDDVLFTGRTIRAAMNALMDFGRPLCIRLAVLVDRGHRELPIKADYVGKNIPTSRAEGVEVRIFERDGIDGVFVKEKQD
ncbi:MAG: bifunctional pyr operon transcriptional regulator/uracil phosphoribosyltransferase PyrR [Thermodesulfobacteriota bacterium]